MNESSQSRGTPHCESHLLRDKSPDLKTRNPIKLGVFPPNLTIRCLRLFFARSILSGARMSKESSRFPLSSL